MPQMLYFVNACYLNRKISCGCKNYEKSCICYGSVTVYFKAYLCQILTRLKEHFSNFIFLLFSSLLATFQLKPVSHLSSVWFQLGSRFRLVLFGDSYFPFVSIPVPFDSVWFHSGSNSVPFGSSSVPVRFCSVLFGSAKFQFCSVLFSSGSVLFCSVRFR